MSEFVLAVVATLFGAIPIGLSLWALLDAAHAPSWAWALVGRRRVAWMAAIMLGTLTVIGGLAVSIWYLRNVRPQIRAAEAGDVSWL